MRQIKSPRAYLTLNIILAGVILLIMGYSLLFSPYSDNYPVACVHEKITGMPCPSCGMSHAFSLIIRGNIGEAAEWNAYALKLFIFFIIQLVMRVSVAVWLACSGRKPYIAGFLDAAVSVVMAAILLWPLLAAQWSALTV